MNAAASQTILVASGNPHKIEEIAAVFAQQSAALSPGSASITPPITFVSLRDIGLSIPEPVEDGQTFADNALLKARYYSHHSRLPTLADDSGLEVDALHNAPGVLSARYAGILTGPRAAIDLENNKRLLRELTHIPLPQRTARFVCTMALVVPPSITTSMTFPSPLIVRGIVAGRILLPHECTDPAQPWLGRGSNGFGYDPLFLIPHLEKTTAELSPDEKNAISHRGHAARQVWQTLHSSY